MKKKGIVKSEMTPDIAADLFAYFVSARFFDRPGDAGRGKADFTELHCAACHGISTAIPGGGPPVVKWESLADPLVLVEQMWNHGAEMRAAFAKRKFPWAAITGQQLICRTISISRQPVRVKSCFNPRAASPATAALPRRSTSCRIRLSRISPRLCGITSPK
jgi:hypothetical protein